MEMVTGGIGTYTRLLIQILGSDPAMHNRTIALFCSKSTAALQENKPHNITIFEIPEDRQVYGKRTDSLGDEHDWYSWNLAHYLLDLTKKGHTFSFFEFSDYGIEAYFPLKMRRAGLLTIATMAVRLHSPELMLFRDNLLLARKYDVSRLTRVSRELFCYQHCDQVIYGAPAMLKRVTLECSRYGLAIKDKAIQIEHPYPIKKPLSADAKRPNHSGIHLAYIGRLEIRKGILHFLQRISTDAVLRKLIVDLDIVFELFGADSTDQNDESVRSQILKLHHIPELRGRIVTHGYMPQGELNQKMRQLDGFIFPSLFENYPNALLEVLHTNAPILISAAGGMPYISRNLPGVYTFTYNANFTQAVSQFLCSIRPVSTRPDLYYPVAHTINASIGSAYANFTPPPPSPAYNSQPDNPLAVDFVVPFFNDAKHLPECLKSIQEVMREKDTLTIVNDASQPEEATALKQIITSMFDGNTRVKIHHMPVNSGPSAVRNAGTRKGKNPLIQFIDADDFMNSTGYQVTKRYLQNNTDVDFAYGLLDNFGDKSHIWVPRDASAMTCLDENYTHSAILIRRTAFEGSGGFDDAMRLHFEDWQFNCKLAFSGYRGEVIPFVSQHYRVRAGSRTFRNQDREAFSREQVIDRSCMNRGPQKSMLDGELLELIGKYSSLINGRWHGSHPNPTSNQHFLTQMSLTDLCQLEGEAFIQAAYGVVLGRSADPEGLKFYARKLNSGSTNRSIIADMMHSSEMKKKIRTLPKEYYIYLRMERFIRNPILKRYLLKK